MASSKRKKTKRRAQELARRLEHNPELLERFESILNLSESDELKTVDDIESVLIEEVRKLGGETLGSWASRREEQLAKKLREENEGVRMREKTLHFHTTFGEVEVEERLWRLAGRSCQRLPRWLQARKTNCLKGKKIS